MFLLWGENGEIAKAFTWSCTNKDTRH